MELIRLQKKDDVNFFIEKKKTFVPTNIRKEFIQTVTNFAYGMTFGKDGEHRSYRSGGTKKRKNGEIFCDTFQGKLAEFFVYQSLKNLGIDCSKPDLSQWNLGVWDDSDFSINGKSISVKSMAYFSNLLLLESKDLKNDGTYIPNQKQYDFFIVVRIKPDLKSIFRSNRILYSDNLELSRVNDLMTDLYFSADIPGYINLEMLQCAINDNLVLTKGSLLNGKTKMDAENYYVSSSDFLDFSDIKTKLFE